MQRPPPAGVRACASLCDALDGEPAQAATIARNLLGRSARPLMLTVLDSRTVVVDGALAQPAVLADLVGRDRAHAALRALRKAGCTLLLLRPGISEAEVQTTLAALSGGSAQAPARAVILPDGAMPQCDAPWRVRVAMARLSHEPPLAGLLALTRGVSAVLARREILGGILDGLASPVLVARVLTETERSLATELVYTLPFALRLATTRELLAAWQPSPLDRTSPLLTACCIALTPRSEDPDVAALQLRLHQAGAVPPGALPPALRARLPAETWRDALRSEPDGFLEALDAQTDPDAYRAGLLTALDGFPELIRGGRGAVAARVIAVVRAHRHQPTGFAGRPLVVDDVVVQLPGGPCAAALTRGLCDPSPEVRRGTADLLEALGPAVAPLVAHAVTRGAGHEATRLLRRLLGAPAGAYGTTS